MCFNLNIFNSCLSANNTTNNNNSIKDTNTKRDKPINSNNNSHTLIENNKIIKTSVDSTVTINTHLIQSNKALLLDESGNKKAKSVAIDLATATLLTRDRKSVV